MIPLRSVNSANSSGVHLNENWLAGPASRPTAANILPPILKTRPFCHKTSSVAWGSERQYSRIFSRFILQSILFIGLRKPPRPGDQYELERQPDPVKGFRPDPLKDFRQIRVEVIVNSHVYVRRVNGHEQRDQSPRRHLLKTRNQQHHTEYKFKKPRDQMQRRRPWQIRRHNSHVEFGIREMIESRANERDGEQVFHHGFECAHSSLLRSPGRVMRRSAPENHATNRFIYPVSYFPVFHFPDLHFRV